MAHAIGYDAQQLQDTAIAESEWSLPTGNGGYACGTLRGVRTRRYHALYVTPDPQKSLRWTVLAEVEAWVIVDGQSFPISTHAYRMAHYPNGYVWLNRVEITPTSVMHSWQLPSCTVTRTLQTSPHGIRLTWQITGAVAQISLTPLMAMRDHHALTVANEQLDFHCEMLCNTWSCRPYSEAPAVWWRFSQGVWNCSPDWYYRFFYSVDQNRGLDFEEDLWTPGRLTADLTASQPLVMELGINEPCVLDLLPATLEWNDLYMFQAEGRGRSILAGLPWFTDWGRDTMIVMPGLLFRQGAYQQAFQILCTFAKAMHKGLIPNRFPDQGEQPEYNTVDATLWFARMVDDYLTHTRDDAGVKKHIWPALKQAMHYHLVGTLHGIKCDAADGLLSAGDAATQLTWMDARVGDQVFTARGGKPIEISGLWIHFMRFYLQLCNNPKYGSTEDQPVVEAMLALAEARFDELYWMPHYGWFADVIDNDGKPNGLLRPNQLIALSLPNPPVSKEHMSSAFDACKQYLLTPYGLRTLAPFETAYEPRYQGGVWQRDSAYHQGTVWPWLLSAYAKVYLQLHPDIANSERQAYLRRLIAPLREYSLTLGAGHIAEVFNADPPHSAGGCFAQAWSDAAVAEILAEIAV